MKIRVFKYLNYLPIVLSAALMLGAVFSLLHIYLHGSAALSSASAGEKYQMSLSINPNLDYRHNESISTSYNCMDAVPVILTADGRKLTGAGAGTIPAPYFNLIGVQAGGNSRYLLDRYSDSGTYSTIYSPLTGILSLGSRHMPEIRLTVDSYVQESMYNYLADNSVSGSVFCYDFTSGDIICAVSAPSCDADADMTDLADGTLINKCLYSTPPGSTMKIVTMLLLADAVNNLDSLTYECKGDTVVNGDVIKCTGVHGALSASEAIGKSCNCWFAQAVYENLSVDKVIETLKSLGWSVNGVRSQSSIGSVPTSPGTIKLNEAEWDFASLWTLIGETEVEVSPSWMAEYAAQLVTGCNACSPRFRIDEPPKVNPMWAEYKDVIIRSGDTWRTGYTDIMADLYPQKLTAGKTGTYEFEGGDAQRNFVGVSEELNAAFYITMDNYRSDGSSLEIQLNHIVEELFRLISLRKVVED